MQDFKDKKALRTPTPAERMENPVVASLAQEAPGWYEGSLDFKRVVMSIRLQESLSTVILISLRMLKLNQVWIVTIAS